MACRQSMTHSIKDQTPRGWLRHEAQAVMLSHLSEGSAVQQLEVCKA
jgi:hypothetical protein